MKRSERILNLALKKIENNDEGNYDVNNIIKINILNSYNVNLYLTLIYRLCFEHCNTCRNSIETNKDNQMAYYLLLIILKLCQ